MIVQPVPLDQLAVLVHADASLKNAGSKGIQGGWIVGICDQMVLDGVEGR